MDVEATLRHLRLLAEHGPQMHTQTLLNAIKCIELLKAKLLEPEPTWH